MEPKPTRKSRNPSSATHLKPPPIAMISSSARIGDLMQESASITPGIDPRSNTIYGPREPWYPSDKDSNPFQNKSSGDRNSKGGQRPTNKQAAIPPGGPPSDDSDSEDDSTDSEWNRHSKPRKEAPLINPPSNPGLNSSRGPHFDMKLKPESVPQWDGDVHTLAQWVSKINRLSEASQAVHQELGAIVPRRLTKTAETWYYSIPD